MEDKNYYLYIDGNPVKVTEEVYREYYRAEDKERYFMGKLKKGHTMIHPVTKQEQYIPSREQSYEHLLEQDWQFPALGVSVEDTVVKASMLEKLQAVLQELSGEEMALVEELFYLEKTEREAAEKFSVSQNTIHYRKKRILDKLKKLMEK
ncbi:MAG: sigma-70 family RNA polymerase sigma factor [Lachnospiraceae bacterium]|nr:sigma-70 family RNA polymerase sigma factor [Lachnospiraceae bacterium]